MFAALSYRMLFLEGKQGLCTNGHYLNTQTNQLNSLDTQPSQKVFAS